MGSGDPMTACSAACFMGMLGKSGTRVALAPGTGAHDACSGAARGGVAGGVDSASDGKVCMCYLYICRSPRIVKAHVSVARCIRDAGPLA